MDGTIWIAYAWQGCYATALYEGLPVAYANPEEGRNSWVGLYGISSESDSPQLAHEFLDLKLAETTCSNAVTLFYYGCANADVMAAIEDPILIEAFGVNEPDILETTNFTPPVTAEQRCAWTSMWERRAGGLRPLIAHLTGRHMLGGGERFRSSSPLPFCGCCCSSWCRWSSSAPTASVPNRAR